MAATTATNPELGRKLIQKFVEQYSKKNPSVYKQYTKSDSTSLNQYDYMQEGEFGTAGVVTEATGIPIDNFVTTNKKTVTFLKRGLAYVRSTEAAETDQFGVMSKVPMKLAKSFEQTKELYFADKFFNSAFTGTDVCPDATPIYQSNGLSSQTGHPGGDPAVRFNNRGVKSGTTYVDVAFGYFGLELALQEMMDTVSYRGLPMPMAGKKKLVVPTRLMGVANRVAGASKIAQSADNDPNFAGGLIADVITNMYLTSATAWFLLDADENPFVRLFRRTFRTKMKEDEPNDTVGLYATEIYAAMQEKPQGVWGTSGA